MLAPIVVESIDVVAFIPITNILCTLLALVYSGVIIVESSPFYAESSNEALPPPFPLYFDWDEFL